MKYFYRFYSLVILTISLFSTTILAKTYNNATCGIVNNQPLSSSYGPWDFTNPEHASKLPIVLGAHFTPEVERLIRGKSSTNLHGDIIYTLTAIPNYHRALYAMSKLEMRDRNRLKNGELYNPDYYTAECFFKRAIYFQPKDAISHMLYAMHLIKLGKTNQAETEYLIALQYQPLNAEINYNLGLLYLDMGDIDKARKHAKTAYGQGFPLDGLKRKLAQLK